MKRILAIGLAAGLLTGAGFPVENQDIDYGNKVDQCMDIIPSIAYEDMNIRCHVNKGKHGKNVDRDDLYEACLAYMEESNIAPSHCSKKDIRKVKKFCKQYLKENQSQDKIDQEEFDRFCKELEDYARENKKAKKNQATSKQACNTRQIEKIVK